MQSAPALTGWSGLPSSLTMRPSRLRAMTPHPAGHSRHTVANHDATPGTSCSLGTTSGRIVSLACWQPPDAAAAPDTLMILKKSRRFIYRILRIAGSMVAGHAFERRVFAGRLVLLAMTFDAPAHRQGRRRRPE